MRGLLLTDAEDTLYAPVDFRALSVREFGTIYEGLLESELSLAEQNLTMDKKGTHLPAGEADPVFVNAGEVYLHDHLARANHLVAIIRLTLQNIY